MRVALTLADQARQPIEKSTSDGERLTYLVHHLNGAGLIQVASTGKSGGTRTYRLDKYGCLKGVFQSHADGADDLIYDRDSGFGRRERDIIEADCEAMLERLEATFTDEGHEAYYL